MKRIYIIALILALAANVFASDPKGERTVNKHWTVNPYLYANNMTLVGIIKLNDAELRSESFEIGAFSGEECRGSEVLKYYAAIDKYLVYLTVYGEDDDVISFRLYDHEEDYELVEAATAEVTFVVNAMHGMPSNPYVFDFTCPLYNVTCQPNIELAGEVNGGGSYFYGQPCTVSATANTDYHFLRWTENGVALSSQNTYTFNVSGTHELVAEFAWAVTDTIADACVSFTWHGHTYDASGVYRDTLPSAMGIDSLVDLHLTIHPDYHIDLYATECEVYYWYDEPYYESGDYEHSDFSVYGCDSIETLHLTILPIRPLGGFGYMSPANNFIVRNTDREFYWDMVPNATQYDFYFWQGDGERPETPAASNLTSTSYHVYGLTHGGVYHWCVVAKNECVESESQTRTFTCQLNPSMTVAPLGMIDFGDVDLGQSRTKTISVSGIALTENISYSYLENSWGEDADYFIVNPANWSPLDGGQLNVTFTPTLDQLYYHSAIRIASGSFVDTVYFMGNVAHRYLFSTEVENEVYSSNDTIDIYGHVEDILGNPVPGMGVTVYMSVMGSHITMPTASDANGDYVVHYIPAYSESGYYQVGSCAYGDYDTTVHDAFDIPGMGRVNSDFIVWNPYQYDTVSGVVEIRNRSRIPISNIQVNNFGLPEGCVVDISGVTELGPLEVGQLHYTVTGTVVSTGNSYLEVPFVLTSNEGVTMNLTCYYYCRPRRGSLDVYPPSVAGTMQRNKQKVLSFMVTNYGNGETGAITVSLPDVEWMSLVGDATMESIQVGESCAFSVMLFPDNNVGLNQYSGSIAVNCANGSGTSIPYRFEAVADTATTVIVDVTDDFTYNTNGGFGPHLAGANVRLKGYYSLETVGEGLTDENGLFVMNDVPEGYYYLYVSADSHLGYSNIIYVDGGQTTRESHQEVYLQYQAITYSWVVVPTEVEDEYEFELVCEIKTNVPVPVVTIQAPTAFDPIEYGDTIHFNMTVRNDGLVDALGVEINMPNEFVEYKFSSLYDFIDTLHANTMVTVPCALTRVPSDDRSVDDCVEGSTRIRHHYYCNYERRWVEFGHPVQITTHCTQTNPNEINFHHLAYEYGFLDWPTGTSGTYYPGGGGGGNGNGGGEPTDPNYDEDDPVAPGSTTHPITIPTNDGCTPCWKVVASAATNLIDAFFGFHTNSFTTCASDAFDYAGEVTFGTVASRALRFGSCVITNIKLSDILDSFMLGRFWSLVNSIKDLIKGYNECYKTVDEPTDRDVPQMDVLFDELDQVGTILEATAGIFDNLFGDEAWHYEPNLDEFIDNFLALVDTTNYTMSPQAMQQLIEISDLSYVSTEHVEAFVERWNRSVEYWDAGYQTEADLPAGYDPDFFQDVSEFVEKFDEVQEAAEAYGYSDVDEMLNHSINGISAVVREHETDVCAKI
ncbi:MAG: hypothetical protein J5682_05825, partial [Prevotella sp.]|nr:hypothetical protein [Prevotella sp.]